MIRSPDQIMPFLLGLLGYDGIADIGRSRHHQSMVEIAGLNYEIIVGSDLQRDGMYLEAWNEANTVIAEIFYSDQDSRMSFTGYIPDLPLPLVEWMIEKAKARLAPEQSNGN